VTEPITENDFLVYVRHARARPKVTGVKAITRFPGLYKDWRRCVAAQYCAEVMDAIVPFNSPNPKKYELLKRTWTLLENVSNPRRIVQGFIVRFLQLSGYSFTEFLKQHPELMPRDDHKIIKQLACLSGNDLDCMADWSPKMEETAEKYIHRYLDLYLSRPLSTKIFLNKIDSAHSRHSVGARS
jgi:hypothetical protein